MLIDSGVCPGVESTVSVTSPSDSTSPSSEQLDRVLDLARCRGSERDRGAAFGELEVAGQEVRVEVGLDDPLDAKRVLCGVDEVLLDIALRIDSHRATGGRVADQVRRVRQAPQVVLAKEHRGRA